jgi:heme/copper-type cytochrome/quinol oxidase subunit 2
MEELIYKQLLEAVKQFFGYINWIFVVALLLISWVITSKTDSAETQKEKKKKVIISTKWKVLLTGIALAGLFALIYPPLRVPEELGKMFFGIFTAMGMHKIGLSWLMKGRK